jgi:hypothetical protein
MVFKKIERPELKLKPQDDEARVLSLVDGHRSVDDIVEISGQGKFHTYSCLYRLLSTGQIELAYAKPQPKKARQRRQISLKFLTVPLSIVLAVGIFVVELLIGNYLTAHKVVSINPIDDEYYEANYTSYQKIFYYKHNRIPSIEEVKEIFTENE